MPVLRYSYQIDHGADFNPPPFQWLKQGANGQSSVVPLAGYTAAAYFGTDPLEANAILSISQVPNAQGSILIDDTNNLVYVSLFGSATALLKVGGVFAWSLWLFSGAVPPVATVLVSGQVNVWPPK
jgi:hypothetical protein